MRTPLTNAGCEDPSALPRRIIEGPRRFYPKDVQRDLSSLPATRAKLAESHFLFGPCCNDSIDDLNQTNHYTRYRYIIGDCRKDNGSLLALQYLNLDFLLILPSFFTLNFDKGSIPELDHRTFLHQPPSHIHLGVYWERFGVGGATLTGFAAFIRPMAEKRPIPPKLPKKQLIVPSCHIHSSYKAQQPNRGRPITTAIGSIRWAGCIPRHYRHQPAGGDKLPPQRQAKNTTSGGFFQCRRLTHRRLSTNCPHTVLQ